MSANPIIFNVEMSCQGCAKAVTGMLKKVEGVQTIDCNVEEKKVTVTGTATSEEMLAAIQKTGKKASLA